MLDDLLKESGVAEAFIEQGIEEGERRMARRMAEAVLAARFTPLPNDVLAAIGTANEATLQDVVVMPQLIR